MNALDRDRRVKRCGPVNTACTLLLVIFWVWVYVGGGDRAVREFSTRAQRPPPRPAATKRT